jgi:ABC-type dipeptide/oligopeptide/nickel transport system permease component
MKKIILSRLSEEYVLWIFVLLVAIITAVITCIFLTVNRNTMLQTFIHSLFYLS